MSKDYFSELEDGINIIKEIIKKYKKNENLEIELRIGQIQEGSFIPGLNSKKFYDLIKEKLDSSSELTKTSTVTEDKIVDNYKKTTSFNGKKITKQAVQSKNNIEKYNLTYTGTPYDIRIAVSKEEIVQSNLFKEKKNSIVRKKYRDSYTYKDYRIDLTKVITINNTVETINYELEIEFLNLTNNISDVYRAHSGLLLLRDCIDFCEKISDDAKLESAD